MFPSYVSKWYPVTPYHVHFIFGVTSYQREKMCSLHPMFTSYLESFHTLSHFIFGVTSYPESLHTIVLHTKCTSYQVHFILSHFISCELHTKPLYAKSLHTKSFNTKSFHTKCTSYQVHFIPSALHTKYFIPSDEVYGRDRKICGPFEL